MKFKDVLKRLLPHRYIVYRGKAGAKKVAITFDDGPHELHTVKILDILKVHNVKATFFVQGNLAEKQSAILKRIYDEGHQLANHGYHHDSCHDVSASEYTQGVQNTNLVIRKYTQSEGGMSFRPPYGDIGGLVFLRLVLKGFRFIQWSVDSRDSFVSNSDELLRYIRVLDIKSGDILLFHDDYSLTVDALPQVLSFIHSKGFKLVTVDEICER